MRRAGFTCLSVFAALVLAGCAERGSDHASHDHDHEEAQAAATFKEGHGLRLAPETIRALGVTTEEVADRSLAYRVAVYASVFRPGSPGLATAYVSTEIAAALERHPPHEAKIVRLDRTRAASAGQVELTLELPQAAEATIGAPLILTGPANNVAAVPVGAVLRSATGVFVYVTNGDAFLRAPVKLGASDGAYQEIIDGVYEGDEVVVSAVEQLWLTELRLTKGGGHSH